MSVVRITGRAFREIPADAAEARKTGRVAIAPATQVALRKKLRRLSGGCIDSSCYRILPSTPPATRFPSRASSLQGDRLFISIQEDRREKGFCHSCDLLEHI